MQFEIKARFKVFRLNTKFLFKNSIFDMRKTTQLKVTSVWIKEIN